MTSIREKVHRTNTDLMLYQLRIRAEKLVLSHLEVARLAAPKAWGPKELAQEAGFHARRSIDAWIEGFVCVPNEHPQHAEFYLKLSSAAREVLDAAALKLASAQMSCTCGAHWSWNEQPSLGLMDSGDEVIDLRNCPHCHTTRALVVNALDTLANFPEESKCSNYQPAL